jgi:heme o synthase
VILSVFTNLETLFIGVLNLVWYNFVYTILKRKTALAVIPGALVGALPPLAGWAAADGNLSDFRIYLIVLYFFIWQIPHFWLLLLLYGKEYSAAGFPVLNDIFTDKQLKNLTFLWIFLTALLTSSIAFAGILNSVYSFVSILLISVILFYSSVLFVKSDAKRKNVFNMFMVINVHTLLIIVFLSFDKILNI